MVSTSEYDRYRFVKGRIDLGKGGDNGGLFFYAVIDSFKVHLVRLCRMISGDKKQPALRDGWRAFASSVDAETGEDPSSLPEDLAGRIKESLSDTDLSEIRESSIAENQRLERSVSRSLSDLTEFDCNVFLRVERIRSTDAEKLLIQFATEDDKEDVEASEEEHEDLEGEIQEEAVPTLDVVLNCSLLVDPVKGHSVGTLRVGERLRVRIPQNSVLYRAMMKERGGFFDGTVEAVICGIDQKGETRSIIDLSIAEGIRGVTVAQNNLLVKMGGEQDVISPLKSIHFKLPTPQNILILSSVALGVVVLLILALYIVH